MVIEVCDFGSGISEIDQRKLFNYRYTTKPEDHGFGLHFCVVTAEEMGGTLHASSDGPGRGSTFRLTISTRVRPDLSDSEPIRAAPPEYKSV